MLSCTRAWTLRCDGAVQASRRSGGRVALCLKALVLVLLTAACTHSSGSPSRTSSKVFHIAMIHVGLDHYPGSLPALIEGLQRLGWVTSDQVSKFETELQAVHRPTCSGERLIVTGPKVELEWRNLKDEAAADKAATELVREKVDLVVAFEGQTIRAAHAATTTIPIVFLHAFEPDKAGFIDSPAHPGGNMTGIQGFPNVAGKQLEMFKNLVPTLRTVIAVTDPKDPTSPDLMADTRGAARDLGVTVDERPASTDTELREIFDRLRPSHDDGVVIASQDLQTKFSLTMIGLALEHGVPISVGTKSRVQKGGLFSYSEDFPTVGARGALYVDKILKGAKPGDLPVEPTLQLDLYVNQKVADQLGLTLSPQWLDIAADVFHRIDPIAVACQG
jgi:putative ABC transport system substrate-binding protein